MRRREIRIAVGQPGDEHSPVFKIFNNKNDVYITERNTGHAFKVSLHESGISVIAATSQSGIDVKDGNRRLESWTRPGTYRRSLVGVRYGHPSHTRV